MIRGMNIGGPGLAPSRNSGGSRAANADGAPRKHAAFHSSRGPEAQSPRLSIWVSGYPVADSFKDTNLLIIGEKFMTAQSLAEVYERLKELRRQGEPNVEVQPKIGQQMRALYDDVVRQGVPERFAELIRKLDKSEDITRESNQLATLVRTLEIKTLADRVFGDEEKAEAWLHRPNAALSGQRPADLSKDELGAAVVREMLERIDHGIFA
jgi:putative toxin-antitoxin system antitoxin component (TIGR02293 family)